MNVTTYTRRYNTLLRDISIHPHKDELLNIMYQQLQEDVDTGTIIKKPTYS